MPGLDWLTARPIAHRGLHDAAAGVIENTASAFAAAIAGGYGIETDLQISADGEAMVHHDDALGRLTEGDGRLADMSAGAIKAVRFKASQDRILTLGELCDLVGGRAPLVLELKSRFDGDARLAQRAADVLANYAGPVAVMSFDPALVEGVRSNRAFAGRAASSPSATMPTMNGTPCRHPSAGAWPISCTPIALGRSSSPIRSGICRPRRRWWRARFSASRC